jgi:hypothetical protein
VNDNFRFDDPKFTFHYPASPPISHELVAELKETESFYYALAISAFYQFLETYGFPPPGACPTQESALEVFKKSAGPIAFNYLGRFISIGYTTDLMEPAKLYGYHGVNPSTIIHAIFQIDPYTGDVVRVFGIKVMENCTNEIFTLSELMS